MNPMEQLKDIHLPAEVGLWPLAYGWWLLIAFALVSVGLAIRWWLKKRRYQKAKRDALEQLNLIDTSAQDWPVQTNNLIKRLVLSYLPSDRYANLHGKDWTAALMNLYFGKERSEVEQALSNLQNSLYRAEPSHADSTNIVNSVRTWIDAAMPPKPQQAGGEHV